MKEGLFVFHDIGNGETMMMLMVMTMGIMMVIISIVRN